MKKVFALILALAMVFAFAACGEEKEPAKTLTMGCSADFAPYEFYDGDDVIGIDAEIAKAVCDKLGYELVISDMDFDTIITAVSTNKVDFGMSGFTVTEDRLKEVNFSESYTTSKQVIVVPNDSPIKSCDDLFADGATYKVGVQTNTTGDIYISGDVEDMGLKLEVKQYTKATDAILALTSGKVDCFIIDEQVGINFCKNTDGISVLESEYILEDYAVAFAKDSEIFESFNAALKELIADGTVQKIIDKYITAE